MSSENMVLKSELTTRLQAEHSIIEEEKKEARPDPKSAKGKKEAQDTEYFSVSEHGTLI